MLRMCSFYAIASPSYILCFLDLLCIIIMRQRCISSLVMRIFVAGYDRAGQHDTMLPGVVML